MISLGAFLIRYWDKTAIAVSITFKLEVQFNVKRFYKPKRLEKKKIRVNFLDEKFQKIKFNKH